MTDKFYTDAEAACHEGLQFIEVATGRKFGEDRKTRFTTFMLAALNVWPTEGLRPEVIAIRRDLIDLLNRVETEGGMTSELQKEAVEVHNRSRKLVTAVSKSEAAPFTKDERPYMAETVSLMLDAIFDVDEPASNV